MARSVSDAVAIQRRYYRATAEQYDAMHNVHGGSAHEFSLAFMKSMISFLDVHSILDVGSGSPDPAW